jgi:hypothetical protein
MASGRLARSRVSFEDLVVGWAYGRDREAFVGIEVVLDEAIGEGRTRIAIDSSQARSGGAGAFRYSGTMRQISRSR